MSNKLAVALPATLRVLVTAAGDRPGIRFLEFFASTLRTCIE